MWNVPDWQNLAGAKLAHITIDLEVRENRKMAQETEIKLRQVCAYPGPEKQAEYGYVV